MSTAALRPDDLDTVSGSSPLSDSTVMETSELVAQTEALAQGIADALSAANVTTTLAAGPADAQDGAQDLLPPGAVHGIVARLRDLAAVQVVLTLGDSFRTPEPGSGDAGDAALPEPWMAPIAAAMEQWAARLGGKLGDAVPITDVDHLRHVLVDAPGTTLIAAGLFDADALVGSVAVVGRTADATTTTTPTTDAGTLGRPAHEPAPIRRGAHDSTALDALAVLADVEMRVTAELGRTRMNVADLLALTPGSLIELDRTAGSPIDLLVNGTLIARGEVVVVDEEYGIRLTEITGSPDN